MTHNKTNTDPVIYYKLGAAILAVLIFLIWYNNSKPEKSENSSANSGQQTVIIKGKQKILYRFSDYPNGRISIELNSDASVYPLGGKIKIKTSSGEIWDDEPGTNHQRPQQSGGTFTFWANDSEAYGVDIWN